MHVSKYLLTYSYCIFGTVTILANPAESEAAVAAVAESAEEAGKADNENEDRHMVAFAMAAPTASASSSSTSRSPAPTPAPPYKSAFAKELGLSEVGVAKTGRSKCWKCTQKIQQNDVRFSYYHSLIRPSAWIHSGCVASLILEEGRQEAAIRRLRGIIDGTAVSDSRLVQACHTLVQELSGRV